MIGLLVNVACCIWCGIERGQANFHAIKPPFPIALKKRLPWCYVSQEIPLLVSAAFLADAIRRFSLHFKQNNNIAVNTKTMRLHITALFVHSAFLIYW
jgi:hypothetical protein